MVIQIIDENRKPTFSESIGFGNGKYGEAFSDAIQSYKQRQEEKKFLKENPEFKNIPNEYRKMAFESKLKKQELSSKLKGEQDENRKIVRALEKQYGKEEGEYEDFVSKPQMIPKPSKSTITERPIDPEQMQKIENVRNQPGFDDLDELQQYRAFTSGGVSGTNAERESKLRGEQLKRQEAGFDKSYEAQKDFINETTDKYKGFETEMKPKLMQMQKINSDEDLIGPTSSVFLETLGIPLGALEDPSSELYNKLSLDLLKGLPETYGNRILKVEVDNFLKTIPQLVNSANGRRMIASNILKLGEMKEVYYNQMRKQQRSALDTGKPLAKDFQQSVFDQVKPQIDRINEEFVKLSEVKSVPKGSIPFFGPAGDIEFVPKEHAQWALENGGKRIW